MLTYAMNVVVDLSPLDIMGAVLYNWCGWTDIDARGRKEERRNVNVNLLH